MDSSQIPKFNTINELDELIQTVCKNPDVGLKLLKGKLEAKTLNLQQDFFIKVAEQNARAAITLLNDPQIGKLIEPKTIQSFPFTVMIKGYHLSDPAVKKHYFPKPLIASLDLAHPETDTRYHKKVRKHKLRMEGLNLEGDLQTTPAPDLQRSQESKHESKEIKTGESKSRAPVLPAHVEAFLAKNFPSVKSYMDKMMFGPSGYYSSGKVKIGKDFVTFASNPKVAMAFASAFAHQLFATWKNQIAQGIISKESMFNVLECGAGKGDLCFNILSVIKKLANDNHEWAEFYQKVHYHIVERSQALKADQEQRNAAFADKLTVCMSDAVELPYELQRKGMSAVFSNELLDVLAPQGVTLQPDGKITVDVVIPSISPESKGYFKDLDIDWDRLSTESKRYQTLLRTESDDIILSENSFSQLHELNSQLNDIERANIFKFKTVQVDANNFPEITEFLKRNPNFIEKLDPGKTRLANFAIYHYLKNVNDVLIPGGEVITIDYGGDDFSLIDTCMRTYKDGKLGKDIFDCPGWKDITYDVNFTTVAQEGKLLGLQTVFFGHQIHLLPPDLNVLSNAVPVASFQAFGNSIQDPDTQKFKVIVQQKTQRDEKVIPDESRFSAESLPISHYGLFKTRYKNVVDKFKAKPVESKGYSKLPRSKG